MALRIAERVKDTSTTTGTGSYTLAGSPPTGFQTFASELATDDYCHYAAVEGANWEVGVGKLTAATTLARTAIISSSNADVEVNWGAGTRTIYITWPRQDGLNALAWFGNGTDGDLTISAGTTTLARDMFYKNINISGSAAIAAAGYAIYVSEATTDTGTSGLGIYQYRNNGTTASGTASSLGGAGPTLTNLPVGGSGGSGAAGGTATGGAPTPTAAWTGMGGAGGAGGASVGKGGTGSSGAGGNGGGQGAKTDFRHEHLRPPPFVRGVTMVAAASGGGGGGGGGGDGTAGGGGGGGGGPAGWVFFASRMISAGGTRPLLNATAGNGGGGFAPTAGNRGGGGGGCGGGGAVIYCVYQHRIGATNASFAVAAGGGGGTGAAGFGTGTAGAGGGGGDGGVVLMFDLTTGALTKTTGAAGSANTGTAGGPGGACTAAI